MKLSAPVYRLKRNAKLLARKEDIPLHEALDRIAVGEGFSSWSLLAAKSAESRPAGMLVDQLMCGELLLLGARPGQGKTLLGLELVVEAMKRGDRGLFFTLEYTEKDVADRFRALGVDREHFGERFELDSSDAINAAHIIGRLATAPPWNLGRRRLSATPRSETRQSGAEHSGSRAEGICPGAGIDHGFPLPDTSFIRSGEQGVPRSCGCPIAEPA